MAHHQGMSLLALAWTCCWTARCSGASSRTAPSGHRAAAAGAHAQGRRPFPHRRRGHGPQRPRPRRREPLRVFTTPDTPVARGAAAVQRALPRDAHQRRRRLQPLAGPGGDPLARGPTCDDWGSFCYLRDVETGEFWSTAHQPTRAKSDQLRGHLPRAAPSSAAATTAASRPHRDQRVSPEDDIELRRVRLTNRTDRAAASS
jgi:cyclic beta-1,2-glucan synthetase